MKLVPLGELMPSRIPSVNPGVFPDEQFTLWSIPSYDAGEPEQVLGRNVGSSKKTVQDGDVLLSKIVPHIRRAWKVSVPNGYRQIASSEWITFRHDGFLSDYIRHFLLTDQFHAQFMGTVAGVGGSLLRAQPKSVAKIGIPKPPLDEQRRIVGLLDRAAEIRRRADAARAKARAIIPALFLDTFGDPATNWRGVTIGEILAHNDNAIRTGPFGSQLKHSEFTNKGVPVLGIDNVVDNEFKWGKPRHLPAVKYETFKRFRVFPGDVVVTIMGTTGRVIVAPDDLPECMNTKHLCAFTLDRSFAHPRFVWGALLFDARVRAQARGQANGQIMEGWNMGIVKSIRLRLPPLPLQIAFAEQAHRLESLARHLDAAAAKADAMAAGLSAEVFGSPASPARRDAA